MTTRIVQTIEDALADVLAEHNLERIDVGLASYNTDQPYLATIWFDAPAGVTGCAAEPGATIDEALQLALAEMHAKLAPQLTAAE